MLLSAAAEHAEEATAFGLGAGAYVALSMIFLFGLMLWAGVPRIVAAALDKKIAGIKAMLAEATTLRAEAERIKAEYEAKLAGAARDAEAMKAAAGEEARHILAKAKDDAEALVGRRRKLAEDKIAAAERNAIADLRAKAAEVAAAAARGLVADNHTAKADKALVDEAISQL